MLFPASLNLGMTMRLALTDEMLSGSEVAHFWEEVYKSQRRICQVPTPTRWEALPKLVDGGFVGRPNSVCRAHSEAWKWKSLSHVRFFETLWTIYSLWDSPGQNAGVGSLPLLQGSSQPRDQQLSIVMNHEWEINFCGISLWHLEVVCHCNII